MNQSNHQSINPLENVDDPYPSLLSRLIGCHTCAVEGILVSSEAIRGPNLALHAPSKIKLLSDSGRTGCHSGVNAFQRHIDTFFKEHAASQHQKSFLSLAATATRKHAGQVSQREEAMYTVR